MTRLAAVEKMMFYPTPPITQARINNFLLADRKGLIRVLDPCAGYGEAIGSVSEHLRGQGATVESFGVEISSEARGPELWKNVNRPIIGDWNSVSMTERSLGLLWLNPPYDLEAPSENEDEKRQRLEYIFLKNTLHKLDFGAVLVYIVPLHIIQNRRYAGYITNNLSDISIYRLPAGEFERFDQIVLFGRRRNSRDESPKQIISEYLDELPPELPEEPDRHYPVPALKPQKIIFRIEILEDDEVISRCKVNGAHTTKQWLQHTQIIDHTEFQPVTPLKVGHISGLISSGQTGVVNLGNILAQGRTSKVIDVSIKRAADEDDPEAEETRVERDRFVTTVTTLDRSGKVTTISDAAALGAFVNEYGEEIGALIAKKYKPMYQKPEEDEWRILAPLMKKKLKGRNGSGLFTAQKHVAIAMKRAIDKMKWVTLVGEMGTGKTATSIATAALNDQWPVVVMAPTHLVDKWAAEVALVIPGAKGFVINDLKALIKFQKEWTPGDKWFAIISKERAKLAPGWKHAYHTKRRRMSYTLPNGNILRFKADLVCCPKCGNPITNDKGAYILSTSGNKDLSEETKALMPTAGNRRLTCNHPQPKWVGDPHDKALGEWKKIDPRTDEPYVCGERLWQVDGFRRWPMAEYIHDKMDGFFKLFIADEVHEYKAKDSAQAIAYHSIRDACGKVINLTGTIFNGKSTSLFWMLYRNDAAVRRIYNFNSEGGWAQNYGRLERTITSSMETEQEDRTHSLKGNNKNKAKEIPGISPAIFSRLLPNTIFLKKSDLGWKLPPYSEEIIRVDMSPNQAAQYEWMQSELFARVMEGLSSRQKEPMKEAQRLLSTWLMRSLGRPDSAFRREMVMWKAIPGPDDGNKHQPFMANYAPTFGKDTLDHYTLENDPDLPDCDLYADPLYKKWEDFEAEDEEGRSVMFLDRVVEQDCILPKEKALLDLAVEEVHNGNKLIVFVNQTGKNDIQERLEGILAASGLRAQVLPKNIEARNRGAWIEKNHSNIDVLICNPEAVKTGLDLVQFNRIAFYEITWNLPTLQQAMARIYRIGQERETKIYFLVYRNSMSEGFLPMISAKIKAAALLYGDSAASAISDEESGGDLREELMNKIMSGQKLSADGLSEIMTPSIEVDTESEWAKYESYQEETEEEPDQPDPIVHQPTRTMAPIPIAPSPWDKWQMPKSSAAKKKAANEIQLTLF